MDSLKVVAELENKYCQIIGSNDLEKLYENKHLSGVFLAAPSHSYFESKRRVMIIGQETRSWRAAKCQIKNEYRSDVYAVRDSMQATLEFNKRKPKTSRFRQFYTKASIDLTRATVNMKQAAVWSNQFCVSYKGNSPTKSSAFPEIRELSKKLLLAQFEVLKPDVAIFTVGSARDKYIKEAFDCKTIDVVVPRRLWHFKIGDTHCFRCNHPRWYGASSFLNQAQFLAKKYT